MAKVNVQSITARIRGIRRLGKCVILLYLPKKSETKLTASVLKQRVYPVHLQMLRCPIKISVLLLFVCLDLYSAVVSDPHQTLTHQIILLSVSQPFIR